MKRFIIVAAALALAPLGAQGADFTKIGPLAPAAGLVMVRQTLQEPALELDYKIEGGDAPGEITVDLAQDFTTLLKGDTIYIYDYKLARLITLNDSAHKFRNDSLYAMVDFFVTETRNRRGQRKLLSGVGADASMLDPFRVQSELHIVEAADGAPTLDRHKDRDGTIRFFHGGAEVASYLPSKQALSAEEGARLARFLKSDAPLHPAIADDIVKSGLLPSRIDAVTWPKGVASKVTWTLQSAVQVKAAYPLYASSRPPAPFVQSGDERIAGLIPVMTAAIAGQAPGKRSQDDYRAATDKALSGGHAFQAMLLVLEQMEQYETQDRCAGVAKCKPMTEIGDAARSDPRTALLGASLQPARDKIEDAIRTLHDMKRDDLANAYMLDEFEANNLVAAGRAGEAVPLMAASIKANPYMAGFYKDAGDAFRAQFDPTTAWLFYDLGRALPGGADLKMLAAITAYEAELAKAHPEFF